MSPAVPSALSSSSASQRPARGSRTGSAWAASGGSSSISKGKGAAGQQRAPASTAANNRFWVQTLNRERASEHQLRQRAYGLSILQQPEKARLSSFKDSSDTSDRRPVDPPIILQVHAVDSRRTDDHPLEFLESVSFFTRAHLVAVEPVAGETVTKDRVPDEVMHAGGDWWKRVKGPKGGEPIAGEELVGGEKMADPEGRMGVFFIFSKLSIRVPGKYRLLFSLYEITGAVVRKKAAVVSEVFEVFSPKLFTGMTASTPLTKHFARQGVKVKIRGTGPLTASVSRLQNEPGRAHLAPPPLPPPPPLQQHQPEAYGSSGSGGAGSRTRKAEDDLRGSTEHYRWSGADDSGQDAGSGWRVAGGAYGQGVGAYYSTDPPPRAYDPPPASGGGLPHLSPLEAYPGQQQRPPPPSTAPPGAPAWPEPGRVHPRSTSYPYDAPPPSSQSLAYPDARHSWAAAPYAPPPRTTNYPLPPPPGSDDQQQQQHELAAGGPTTTGAPWQQETSTYLPHDGHDQAPRGHWQDHYPLLPPPPVLGPGSSSAGPPPFGTGGGGQQPSFTFSAAAPPPSAYREPQHYAESTPSGLTSPSTAHSTPPVVGRAYLPNPPPSRAVDYRFHQPAVDRPPPPPPPQPQQPQQQQQGPEASADGQRSGHDSFGYSYQPYIYRDAGDPWGRVLHPSFVHDPAFLGSYPTELAGAGMLRPANLAPFPRQPTPGEQQQQAGAPPLGQQPSQYGYAPQHQQHQQHAPPPPPSPSNQPPPPGYGYALAPPVAIDPTLDSSGAPSQPPSPSHNP